jgi:hypothetical protein
LLFILTILILGSNYQDILPSTQNPWTVQICALSNPVNTWGLHDSLYQKTGQPLFPYQVPALLDSRRIWRCCLGGYPAREEAEQMADYLQNHGFTALVKQMQGIVLGSTGEIEIRDTDIELQTGEVFPTNDEIQGYHQHQRAALSPDQQWAALIFSSGTGFENEGECLVLARISDGEEKIGLVSTEMIYPLIWDIESDNPRIIVSTQCGGVGYGNIYMIDVENGQILWFDQKISVYDTGEDYVKYYLIDPHTEMILDSTGMGF